jgi:hypothetical protein
MTDPRRVAGDGLRRDRRGSCSRSPAAPSVSTATTWSWASRCSRARRRVHSRRRHHRRRHRGDRERVPRRPRAVPHHVARHRRPRQLVVLRHRRAARPAARGREQAVPRHARPFLVAATSRRAPLRRAARRPVPARRRDLPSVRRQRRVPRDRVLREGARRVRGERGVRSPADGVHARAPPRLRVRRHHLLERVRGCGAGRHRRARGRLHDPVRHDRRPPAPTANIAT